MLGGDITVSDVHLPGGDFTAVLSALRLEYDVNTRLSLLGFVGLSVLASFAAAAAPRPPQPDQMPETKSESKR